jgi:hypothetical protein
MRKQTLYMLLLLLLMIGNLQLSGCAGTTVMVGDDPYYRDRGSQGGPPPWAPAHGYRAKYRYYYYPGFQIYYDPARSLYFYFSEGGWQASGSLPRGGPRQLGDRVTLHMDTDRPFQFHPEVTKRYPPGSANKKPGGGPPPGKP